MFNYSEAFSRNLGWLTPMEQEEVRSSRIGVIGCGGVGGSHIHALVRIGFQNFKIADLDTFDLQNFNRQFGSGIRSLGQDKTEILESEIKNINPNAKVQRFPAGIDLTNMAEFLQDIDIVVDGLDLYASELRQPVYDLALSYGVYVVTAGPFGMGTSLMAFDPNGVSFGDYFDLKRQDLSRLDQIIHFLVGLSPTIMHRSYVAQSDAVDLAKGRLPSLHVGVYSASSAMSAAVLKIVLKRGKVKFAPHFFQVDFYLNRWKNHWMPFGNRNWMQRIKIFFAKRMFRDQDFNKAFKEENLPPAKIN
ncbi:MAG: ThiF family adenylyltransferase [Bdellovibrionales bacterium]